MSEISKEQTTPESPLPLLDDEQEADLGRLSYRQLVWRKFRKSRLAVIGGVILVVFYTLAIFAEMMAGVKVNAKAMRAAALEGFSTATDLADWLVREAGLPFREAHHVTGRAVAMAEAQK
ncbi:MAG: hypothetical protein NT023_05480, partial [Armatimonadetes bacterium]|nr:hypothetical protein [Armatimonadota bacterium]